MVEMKEARSLQIGPQCVQRPFEGSETRIDYWVGLGGVDAMRASVQQQ